MASNNIPTVKINYIPCGHQSYFQWFLAGLYILEKQGKIRVKFSRKNILRYLSTIISNEFICKCIFGFELIILHNGSIDYEDNIYCLDGSVRNKNNFSHFCLDCSDAPYSFNSKLLHETDIYFKMQCPKEIKTSGFQLTKDVIIPYIYDDKFVSKEKIKRGLYRGEREKCENISKFIDKIKPAMIGVRRLSFSNSRKSLLSAYNRLLNSGKSQSHSKKAMCYFGNAAGPELNYPLTRKPDYIAEAEIMSYYGEKLHHPNVKRSMVNSLLKSLGGDMYDARVINDGNSDTNIGGLSYHSDLIIPLNKFSEHVSQFDYNINISGYRMSIPNRFIDSFVVGTAIFTDKLFVKWYLPFSKDEVIETIQLGYLPNSDVDWETYKKDLLALPVTDRERILQLFHKKWAPDKFAKYIIDTALKTHDEVENA